MENVLYAKLGRKETKVIQGKVDWMDCQGIKVLLEVGVSQENGVMMDHLECLGLRDQW